jgi:hypothetical protein
LVVELRVLVGFWVFASRVAQLGQAFLGRGSDEISHHVINTTFRVDEVLFVFSFDLDLLADNPVYHVYRLFFSVLLLRFFLEGKLGGHGLIYLHCFNLIVVRRFINVEVV